ncbi:surface lipoprotein assembly modifier [Falsiroseomonas sp. CW058]|uniref:surface lipoprotein assembly modifier n=1 Tax=Falsiroseomonas sp. CW058 TaxID=3388664 RepID=UPI003D316EE3
MRDLPRGLAAAALLLLAPVPALSQPAAAPSFAEVMADPGNPDLALRYARNAAAQGDSRAAIAALERVLRIDPGLDNIRLEIASIHLATGSSDLAALYAQQALASPSIPPEVAARARQILAQAERGAARSLLEVNLSAGLRWDSNANGVTPAGTVPIFVPALGAFLPAQLQASGESDWSSVLGARIAHRYDLELQREGAWETNASLYDQRFARIPRQYDLGIVSVDTGPRIGVAEIGEAGTLALRPFATATWIGYADRTYGWLYGAGLTAELRLPPRWTVEATALGRFGNYANSDFRPRARDYTGAEAVLSLGASYALSEATRLSASVSYIEGDARQDFYARSGFGGLVAVQSTLRLGAYQFGATARAGVREMRYDAPDPVLNPFEKRQDTRWEAGAALILPVTARVAVTLEYDWFDQRSNYRIYRFDNHAVMLGLRLSL